MRRTSPTIDALSPRRLVVVNDGVGEHDDRAPAAATLSSLTHGLRRTYQAAACRCAACCAANTTYMAGYREAARIGRRPLGAHVTGIDVHRRIAALLEDGFTRGEIARALGQAWPRLQYRARVTLRTLLRVRRLQRQWTS